jgi:hypothetical protein
MKVMFVTGGRDYTPTEDEKREFLKVVREYGIDILVHGACPTGVDSWASKIAEDAMLWVVAVPAPWKRHGKFAGPKRNAFAVRLAVLLSGMHRPVAYVFSGGRGTADAANRAREAGFIMVAKDGAR